MVPTVSQPKLYRTRIDIPTNIQAKEIEILNQTLAATLDLETRIKQAHWNVKGMNFYQLHELFDEMATELEEYIDMVAERVTALSSVAMGTTRIAASDSIISEYDLSAVTGVEHVAALANSFSTYAKHVRESINATDELGDADTADLYTEISRTIDKRLWFLEAHLL